MQKMAKKLQFFDVRAIIKRCVPAKDVVYLTNYYHQSDPLGLLDTLMGTDLAGPRNQKFGPFQILLSIRGTLSSFLENKHILFVNAYA